MAWAHLKTMHWVAFDALQAAANMASTVHEKVHKHRPQTSHTLQGLSQLQPLHIRVAGLPVSQLNHYLGKYLRKRLRGQKCLSILAQGEKRLQILGGGQDEEHAPVPSQPSNSPASQHQQSSRQETTKALHTGGLTS